MHASDRAPSPVGLEPAPAAALDEAGNQQLQGLSSDPAQPAALRSASEAHVLPRPQEEDPSGPLLVPPLGPRLPSYLGSKVQSREGSGRGPPSARKRAGALARRSAAPIQDLLESIAPSIAIAAEATAGEADDEDIVDRVVQVNAVMSATQVLEALKETCRPGSLEGVEVQAAVYSLDTGAVDFLNVREQVAKTLHTEEDLDRVGRSWRPGGSPGPSQRDSSSPSVTVPHVRELRAGDGRPGRWRRHWRGGRDTGGRRTILNPLHRPHPPCTS